MALTFKNAMYCEKRVVKREVATRVQREWSSIEPFFFIDEPQDNVLSCFVFVNRKKVGNQKY